MKEKINNYIEYRNILKEITELCDEKISSKSEIREAVNFWSDYFNVSKLEYIKRLKVYVSFYKLFWFPLDMVNNYYKTESRYK